MPSDSAATIIELVFHRHRVDRYPFSVEYYENALRYANENWSDALAVRVHAGAESRQTSEEDERRGGKYGSMGGEGV